MKHVTAFVFRYRNSLAALPLVLVFFSARWDLGADWDFWPLAAILCFSGALLRAWARWHNSYAQGRRKTLARTGPYGLVRNPLYIGTLFVIAGASVASGSRWLLPAVIGWAFLVFVIACRHEEERLLAKYGPSYEAYRAQVPAWVPRALPGATVPIRGGGFARVLAVQVLYASLWLVPFFLKEIDPLGIWPS